MKSPSRPLGMRLVRRRGHLHRLRLMSSRETIWLWGPPSALAACPPVACVLFPLLCGAGSREGLKVCGDKVFSLTSENGVMVTPSLFSLRDLRCGADWLWVQFPPLPPLRWVAVGRSLCPSVPQVLPFQKGATGHHPLVLFKGD